MEIRVDDLEGQEVADLLQEHISDMRSISPPESKHALDLEGLRKPEITFWTVWDGRDLAGCGAIKRLDAIHAELKSMRTANAHRGKGIASTLLTYVIEECRRRGYKRLSLETGAFPFFEPARRLYAKFGFVPCGPFADYRPDPNSVFMTMAL